jgi:hypothetical protein
MFEASGVTGVLRFLLDPGAGGCLWAGDPATRERLGYGPVDAVCHDLHGQPLGPAPVPLSDATLQLRDAVMREVLAALDLGFGTPGWSTSRIEAEGDRLLAVLRAELGEAFEIRDERGQQGESG